MNNFIVSGKNAHIAKTNILFDIIATVSTYACLLPLIFLDISLWQFQNIYFRIMEIPLIERKKYVILDRFRLGKLSIWQRINCLYCEYANGIVGYSKAVVNQMELYSCAIKHAAHPLGQEHQKDFFDRKDFE